MLVQLQVRQFAIVKDLNIELKAGMTAITGETGAGKSIALDALGLCLGDRAEASMVRPGAEKAEISAVFDIRNNLLAQQWLQEHELEVDDNHDCILRRTLSKEGRSKGYINGAPAPISLLKGLAPLLVNIHGQHEHQLLSQPDHQLRLLDHYADHSSLLQTVRKQWREWQQLRKEKKQIMERSEHLSARQQLIRYQVKELQEFNLQEGEFTQIETDHQRLAHASTLRDESAFAINCMFDGEHNNAFSLVQTVIERLSEQTSVDASLQPVVDLLAEAGVQIEEAVRELRHYHDDIDVDSEELVQLEKRMTSAIQLAKKHQISAEQLPELRQQLEAELAEIEQCSDKAEHLDEALIEAKQAFITAANSLSQSRIKSATKLAKNITESMQQLNMKAAQFKVSVDSSIEHASALGIDHVLFNVSTNPGQPLQPLQKVASGGELSRISLAIQVITAHRANTPTLMFDEVDVGVSGPTAATVGSLLRRLGETNQVICVTHLPQVAAKAHQQMRVEKTHRKNSTETIMVPVQGDERIIEVARLLGGDEVSEKALANAQELLAS
ncbi:DNA repair protein RecN [Aliidiomarina sedimenti]|uniref:DNA repair protein RecN n=1 Tax=Aliidiomarina sedimenti TaxID=1933879 RepID=A0ABY0C3E8_9GAMM|nr:DNA repair protein RecN [Aliidiomarina sedimenti]RUO32188.1 DNA repair protein RecN [Aliidiomarina sedimenti]